MWMRTYNGERTILVVVETSGGMHPRLEWFSVSTFPVELGGLQVMSNLQSAILNSICS